MMKSSNAPKFNLRVPVFQNFPGGGMLRSPSSYQHALHADCVLCNKGSLCVYMGSYIFPYIQKCPEILPDQCKIAFSALHGDKFCAFSKQLYHNCENFESIAHSSAVYQSCTYIYIFRSMHSHMHKHTHTHTHTHTQAHTQIHTQTHTHTHKHTHTHHILIYTNV